MTKPNKLSTLYTCIAILLLVKSFTLHSQIITPGQEYWQLVPGYFTQGFEEVGNEMVYVTSDYGLTDFFGTSAYMRNILHFYRYSTEGKLITTKSFNLNDYGLRHAEISTWGYDNVYRLSNGNVLIGAHASAPYDTIPPWDEKLEQMTRQNFDFSFDTLSHKSDGDRADVPIVNPVIATFNPQLDSLLRIDTLPAVRAYGAITAFHEVAPDTLIIVYHKRKQSLHEIVETDSLFNVRWSQEFGHYDYWDADVADFMVTPQGHYKVMLRYIYGWNAHPLGVQRNQVYMFHWQGGDLITSYSTWSNTRGYNFGAAMAPYQDDKMVIATDDCCERAEGGVFYHNWLNFNENTGLYLTIRDYLGNVIEERNISDFMELYMEAFIGPDIVHGLTIEDPSKLYPWFIPYEMICNDDGTYLIAGIQYSEVWTRIGRGFLLKLDADLNPLWVRRFEIDKKNYYYYVDNRATVFQLEFTNNRIHVGGWFRCDAFEGATPYYTQNYPWIPSFTTSFYINLDEYGCAEPGCQIVDNIDLPAAGLRVKFYPNPASDMLNIDMGYSIPGHTEKILYISDMKGNQVLTHRFSGQQLTIPVNQLTSGVYLAYIFAHGQVMVREKIVME